MTNGRVACWVFERNYLFFRLFCHLLDCSMCQLVGFGLRQLPVSHASKLLSSLWVAVTKLRGNIMDHAIIIGIDVSKSFADACALSTQGEVLLESKIYYDTVDSVYTSYGKCDKMGRRRKGGKRNGSILSQT